MIYIYKQTLALFCVSDGAQAAVDIRPAGSVLLRQ